LNIRTPTSFNLFYQNYTDSGSPSPPAIYLKAVPAEDNSGLVIKPDASADNFAIDSLNRLFDLTAGGFIAKNTKNIYPIEIIENTAAMNNTPTCSACNNVVQCDYPGTTGNSFALCYGYLALGQPGIWGQDSDGNGDIDCFPITLKMK
jgi:hypothetical protein